MEHSEDGCRRHPQPQPRPGLFPPHESGSPQGIAVGADGTLYYADLDLTWDFPEIGPGDDGRVRRIRFDAGGGLDRGFHGEPVEIELVYDDGTRRVLRVGMYGTVEG